MIVADTNIITYLLLPSSYSDDLDALYKAEPDWAVPTLWRSELKVFTLVVLTSGDRHAPPVSIVDFDPRDLSGRPLHEIPHKIIYLCPKYVSEETPQPYRE
jgi:hypothetical protein